MDRFTPTSYQHQNDPRCMSSNTFHRWKRVTFALFLCMSVTHLSLTQNWNIVESSYFTGMFTIPLTLVNGVVFLPRDATQSAVLPGKCPSVCLSLTLRYPDHIGWKSSKIISRLVSLGWSLSEDPNVTDLLQGEHPRNFGRNREYRKAAFGVQKLYYLWNAAR